MKNVKELTATELLDEFEELFKYQIKKPKTFEKDESSNERMELIYDEVLHRVFTYES